jgi:hypothetical protein
MRLLNFGFFLVLSVISWGCWRDRSISSDHLADLKRIYLVASTCARDLKSEDSSGFIELDEIWHLLPEETQTRMLDNRFSYFPLRIGDSHLSPLASLGDHGCVVVIYNDGSSKLKP